MQTSTLSARVKNKYAVVLRQITAEVSQVFNRICDSQQLTAGTQQARGNMTATNNIPEAGDRLPVAAGWQGGYQE